MNQKPRRLMHRAMPLILGGSLVKQIVIALVLGILLALVAPGAAGSVGILGGLFVSALKAVAPILVFVLVQLPLQTISRARPHTCDRFWCSTLWAPLRRQRRR